MDLISPSALFPPLQAQCQSVNGRPLPPAFWHIVPRNWSTMPTPPSRSLRWPGVCRLVIGMETRSIVARGRLQSRANVTPRDFPGPLRTYVPMRILMRLTIRRVLLQRRVGHSGVIGYSFVQVCRMGNVAYSRWCVDTFFAEWSWEASEWRNCLGTGCTVYNIYMDWGSRGLIDIPFVRDDL